MSQCRSFSGGNRGGTKLSESSGQFTNNNKNVPYHLYISETYEFQDRKFDAHGKIVDSIVTSAEKFIAEIRSFLA